MKGKHLVLQLGVLAFGALTLGVVLAAVDFREANTGKGQTQAQKSAVKADKQSPAVQKVAPKGNVSGKSIKAGDGSVKQ